MKHTCAVMGCNRPVRTKGFCAADYQKYRMLKRTHRLPGDWQGVADGTLLSKVDNVILPRGRAGANALQDARDTAEMKKTRKRVLKKEAALKTEKQHLSEVDKQKLIDAMEVVDPPKEHSMKPIVYRGLDGKIFAEGVRFSNGTTLINIVKTVNPGTVIHVSSF